MKLNRLDGWERLSVVLGVVLALTVAIYAPYDETGTLQKRGFFKVVPWYGVVQKENPDLFDEFGVSPSAGGNVFDQFDEAKPGNRKAARDAPWESDPVVAGELTDEEVGLGKKPIVDPFDGEVVLPSKSGKFIPIRTYIDTRFTILFMALAAVLPYSLLAVVRWIAAGFKNVKG